MEGRVITSASKLPTMSGGGGKGGGSSRFDPSSRARDARGAFRRILGLFVRSGKAVFIAAGLTAVSSGCGVAAPYFLGRAFDAFAGTGGALDRSLLLTILSVLVLVHITNWLVTTVSGVLMLRATQRLVFGLRRAFFEKLQHLPLGFFDTTAHGDTMSRITNDVDSISSTIASSATQIVSSVLTLTGSVAVMLSLSWRLTLVVLICFPMVYGVMRLIATKSRKYYIRQQKRLGELNGVVEESILGMKMVKAFSRQDQAVEHFTKVNEELYDASYRAQTWAGFMMPLTNVISNLTFAFVATAGGVMSLESGLAIGIVVSFLSYTKQFVRPLNNVASLYSSIQQALAGAERVFEVMDMAEETPDGADAVALGSVRGEVRFEHVSFSYDKHTPVLRDVSFSVKPGETVALVGETGSGKTTVVNLMTRYYDADEGKIFIDGVEITKLKRESLRSCFSVVLQETCLFTGTIMENIRYSRPQATNGEVVAAAKLARADDFIRKLPRGYQTEVSGGSDNLSEGQRQLLAIARAVLSGSPILILDEATSSVDTGTEKDIQRAMVKLMNERTSFLIAHRLSTIRDADRIMVLANGRIIESGSHSELMSLGGSYYEMVMSQTGRE